MLERPVVLHPERLRERRRVATLDLLEGDDIGGE
jgi:hypothetical protein